MWIGNDGWWQGRGHLWLSKNRILNLNLGPLHIFHPFGAFIYIFTHTILVMVTLFTSFYCFGLLHETRCALYAYTCIIIHSYTSPINHPSLTQFIVHYQSILLYLGWVSWSFNLGDGGPFIPQNWSWSIIICIQYSSVTCLNFHFIQSNS